MPKLRGPRAVAAPSPAPDLGLSPQKAVELETAIQQLCFRWRPQTATPEALRTDLYRLVEWVLHSGDRPPDPPVCSEG